MQDPPARPSEGRTGQAGYRGLCAGARGSCPTAVTTSRKLANENTLFFSYKYSAQQTTQQAGCRGQIYFDQQRPCGWRSPSKELCTGHRQGHSHTYAFSLAGDARKARGSLVSLQKVHRQLRRAHHERRLPVSVLDVHVGPRLDEERGHPLVSGHSRDSHQRGPARTAVHGVHLLSKSRRRASGVPLRGCVMESQTKP